VFIILPLNKRMRARGGSAAADRSPLDARESETPFAALSLARSR
jgi:hypothetical protein